MVIVKGNEHPEENLCWVNDPSILWKVVRTDDNGITFTVKANLPKSEATTLYEILTARGHKQVYSVAPILKQS